MLLMAKGLQYNEPLVQQVQYAACLLYVPYTTTAYLAHCKNKLVVITTEWLLWLQTAEETVVMRSSLWY